MYQVLLEEMYSSFDGFKTQPKAWIGIKNGDPKFPIQKALVEVEKRRKRVGSYLAKAPEAATDDARKLESLEELEPWPVDEGKERDRRS